VIGSILGVKLLLIVSDAFLYLVMAVVTLYYAITGLLSQYTSIQPFNVKNTHYNQIIFGFIAGLVGSSTNAMSPILMMYLLNRSDNKDEIVKVSNICYLLSKLLQISLLHQELSYLFSTQYVMLCLIMLISIVFLFMGVYIRPKLSTLFFRNLVYVVLLILGLKVEASGLMAVLLV